MSSDFCLELAHLPKLFFGAVIKADEVEQSVDEVGENLLFHAEGFQMPLLVCDIGTHDQAGHRRHGEGHDIGGSGI